MLDKFFTGRACNTYILYNTHNDALVIDPGDNINNCLVNHIHKLNLNVTAILITHGHYDHIGGLESLIKAFPDAVAYCSSEELKVVSEPRYNLGDFTFVPSKLVLLEDYEIFCESGYEIQMLKTPFHTCGSSCFYIAKENILFSGDTLFHLSIGRTDLPSGSSKTISSSLSKLIKLPLETKIYPGHDESTTIERELKYNTYLRNL